jgi:transcriptional regulator with XRE-family HTH domain
MSHKDEKTGAEMRRLREQSGISLIAVARVLNKSPHYMSQLEQGKQQWTPDLEKRYREIIEGS